MATAGASSVAMARLVAALAALAVLAARLRTAAVGRLVTTLPAFFDLGEAEALEGVAMVFKLG